MKKFGLPEMKFFPSSIKTFLHNPERTYPKLLYNVTRLQYKLISDVHKQATSLADRESDLKVNILQSFFFIFWLHWVFVAAHRLLLVVASGSYSSLQSAGFSSQWLLLWNTGSRCVGFSSCGLWALEHRLSSCGARA